MASYKPVTVDPEAIPRKQWMMREFRKAWPKLLILVLVSLVMIGLQLLNPWPLKLLVDSVFGDIPAPGPLEHLSQSYQLLVIVALSYVGLYLMSGLLEIVDAYLTAKFSNTLSIEQQKKFFTHTLSLPLVTRRKRETGDYVYRLNEEADNLPALIFSTSSSMLSSVVTIIAASVILAILNWQMALIVLLVVPLLFSSIRYFTPLIEEKSNEIEVAGSEIYSFSSESIDNATVVQAFNRQGYQTKKLGDLLRQRMRTLLGLSLLEGKFDYANNIFTAMGVSFVLLIGGYKVFNQQITLGELLIFVTYMSYFYDPLQNIMQGVGQYKSLIAGVKRVYNVLNDPIDASSRSDQKIMLPRAKGHLEFKNVSFSHSEHKVLENVNFEIQPGQKVAFIGPSGSGKSTILSLLPRFNNADSGFIYLDGHEIRDLTLENLRDQMGYVSQEPSLFSGSIHMNIGFGIPEEKLDLPDIIMAAKAANAYEFISKLPNGFDTDIGESGDNLSGGQKQRIAIARAFVKNPPILLLDEPTSALDHKAGTQILSAIRNLMAGKTVLLSTHEMSLLKDMDVIYVVSDGKVTDIKQLGGLDAYIENLTKAGEDTSKILSF